MELEQKLALSREDEQLVQEALLEVANSEIKELEGQLAFIAHLIGSITDDNYKPVAQEIIHLLNRVLETPTYKRNTNKASRLIKAREILGDPERHKVCLGCESVLSSRPNICPICHGHAYETRVQATVAISTRSVLVTTESESFDGLAS